jgi:hypothetical protein
MKTLIPFVKALALLLCSNLFIMAAPFDSKMVQWTQPNGVTFTARFWGDEFEWRMETQAGYRIIRGSGCWYYYATLDANGNYSPTNFPIGNARTFANVT